MIGVKDFGRYIIKINLTLDKLLKHLNRLSFEEDCSRQTRKCLWWVSNNKDYSYGKVFKKQTLLYKLFAGLFDLN